MTPFFFFCVLVRACMRVVFVDDDDLFWVWQVLYFKVSGRVLPLNTQTKALLIAILLPTLSCLSVIVIHLTMVEFNVFQVSRTPY